MILVCDMRPASLVASMCVVKLEGTPYLCKADEVGEICVDSRTTATAYYGLLGITRNVFEVWILPWPFS